MSGDDTWEVYAIQYAHRPDRHRYETFITNAWTDPLHDTLQPISYYVWAIVNRERAFVVDTGFDASELERRRRESGDRWQPRLVCSPAEGLARIGVDAAKVRDVVVTHLHFDHAGTLTSSRPRAFISRSSRCGTRPARTWRTRSSTARIPSGT